MVEEKNKNNNFLLIIIIVLLIIVIGLSVYILIGKNSNSKIENSNETNKEQTKNESVLSTDNSNLIVEFDSSKAINSKEKNYTLACQGNAGIYLSVDSTQKTLIFNFTPTRVVESYPLNWTSTRDDMINSKINFDKKIIDVFFGGMGQSSSGDTVFILLEDGTVEYIPIVAMFNNVQAEVISYGKINGVSDVVKFTLANTIDGVTTLAIRGDGSFYDMQQALKDTGNY